jgi:hypothetical protein
MARQYCDRNFNFETVGETEAVESMAEDFERPPTLLAFKTGLGGSAHVSEGLSRSRKSIKVLCR